MMVSWSGVRQVPRFLLCGFGGFRRAVLEAEAVVSGFENVTAMGKPIKSRAVIIFASPNTAAHSMAHRRRFWSPISGPDVEPFLFHLYTALAEKERAKISGRTKAALAAQRPVDRFSATIVLNLRGVATARGVKWEAATVANVLKRVAARRGTGQGRDDWCNLRAILP